MAKASTAPRKAKAEKSVTTIVEHVEVPGPTEFSDPRMAIEVRRAAVWLGMALLIVGVIVLAQPIMLIIGGLVFSVILDGGTRLLGRVLPIPRGWRLAIVALLGFGFIGWVFYYAGTTLAAQAEALRAVVMEQAARLMAVATSLGLLPEGGSITGLQSQVLGGVGRLTSAVGSALGALTSMFLMIVIGIFIAMEPRLYDRGVAWMFPVRYRSGFYAVSNRVGFTLRRLLAGRLAGMAFEGVFTFLMLLVGGVPFAALLGLITGLLAFLPNIGAIISGVLMIAVGFSAGTGEGLWAIFVYFFVQNVDGYLVVPYIARRTVDLAPAVVLAAQLVFGALFGILGLMLADPIVAAVKVTLEEWSKRGAEADEGAG
ncbi:AI-2E family transporter [Sphingomonas rhizophila]|uniref:AI-2E family transporter n=1 Tax=Sphingomonas rhizophila TaxID=2071607 RepID=A0A7G9SAZ4_9SPHN|nr:AI-2E family transporter [Sphingomonas rhizophila]QNN65019.1 AI-2E family transporter [Sphingomonas rhizophila]